MRFRFLLLLGLLAFAGCETVAAIFAPFTNESRAVNKGLNSPNEQIQSEAIEAKQAHPWML
jgi:hypothetical protein